MPVLTASVHAHILTKPSRAGFAVIRLELIEPGAETCVYQSKASSPTDQPVRKFKDDLGINMTMKIFFILTHRIMFRVVPAAHAWGNSFTRQCVGISQVESGQIKPSKKNRGSGRVS